MADCGRTNDDEHRSVPIGWWSGGPGAYPGAEHFVVQVRYGPTDKWQPVEATNGQNIEGSGFGRELKPGESIVVPLAIPVDKPGVVFVTIRPREWRIADSAEGTFLPQ